MDCALLREIAYNNAISQYNYDEAERLCLTEPKHCGAPYWHVSLWLHRLYEVYKLSRNTGKQIDTARDILLSGDFNYYAKLKELMTSHSKWSSEYITLRNECADKLPYAAYMQVLNSESEYVLLLEQLQNTQSMSFPMVRQSRQSILTKPAPFLNAVSTVIRKEQRTGRDTKLFAIV